MFNNTSLVNSLICQHYTSVKSFEFSIRLFQVLCNVQHYTSCKWNDMFNNTSLSKMSSFLELMSDTVIILTQRVASCAMEVIMVHITPSIKDSLVHIISCTVKVSLVPYRILCYRDQFVAHKSKLSNLRWAKCNHNTPNGPYTTRGSKYSETHSKSFLKLWKGSWRH